MQNTGKGVVQIPLHELHDMNPEQPNLVSAAKIIAATLLAGVGAVGLYAPFYEHSVHARVAVGMLILGLWLLVGAWTGRSVGARLRALYFWSSRLGVDSSKAPTEYVRGVNPGNEAPSA